jgi:hypothetical protein
MADDSDNSPEEITEIELLEITREEAHRTIDSQIDNLDDIDTKAAKILRVNLVFIGILLTGVSIIASNNGSNSIVTGASDVLNVYVILGGVCILISTILAAFTYTATSLRSGMSGRDIENLLENDYSPEENYRGIVESYSVWLQYNFKVNTCNAPLGTSILLFLIYSIILISTAVFNAFVHEMGISGNILLFLLFILITWRSGFKGQIERYWQYRDFTPGKD